MSTFAIIMGIIFFIVFFGGAVYGLLKMRK